MMENYRRMSAAALAGGLALAALIGCGRRESVASKSAAAFEEAQKRGETFKGEGHAHGDHGAGAPMPQETAPGEEHAGHGEAQPMGQAGQHQHAQEAHPADHSAMGHESGSGSHDAGGHAEMGHGKSASPEKPATTGGHGGHAGHGAPSPQAPAGHSTAEGVTPSAPALPTQPASILRPDTLDAPAATSVLDAQRSEEMNREMSGGHGGHGAHGSGTYRQIDAGRGPEAHEGSEPQTPGAGPQHHGHEGGSSAGEAAAYVCPMHPEITSTTPGTCPICGMNLIERREE